MPRRWPPGSACPKALGDFLILAGIYASRGEAVAVTDEAHAAACRDMARLEGVFAAPEGGAGLAAIRRSSPGQDRGGTSRSCCSTPASGYKYLEAWQAALPEERKGVATKSPKHTKD